MSSRYDNEKHKKERLGLTKLNNQGLPMTIIKYDCYDHIIVRFKDGVEKSSNYKCFKNGQIKNPNYKGTYKGSLKKSRINQVNYSNEGDKMFIKQYDNCCNIVVEFCDEYHAQVHTTYDRFVAGEVRNPYHIGLFGEIKGDKYPIVINGKITKEYNTWKAILNRVFGDHEKYNKSYDNTKIDPEWLYYPNFYEWLLKQPNYELWKNGGSDWNIDKDILSSLDNKIYSADTCCLIPRYVNNSITNHEIGSESKKHNLPAGVYKNHRKYYFVDGGKYYIFDTKEEASKGYIENRNQKRKEIAMEAYNKGEITENIYNILMDDNFIYR